MKSTGSPHAEAEVAELRATLSAEKDNSANLARMLVEVSDALSAEKEAHAETRAHNATWARKYADLMALWERDRTAKDAAEAARDEALQSRNNFMAAYDELLATGSAGAALMEAEAARDAALAEVDEWKEAAVYENEHRGKNRYRMFKAESQLTAALAEVERLREALERIAHDPAFATVKWGRDEALAALAATTPTTGIEGVTNQEVDEFLKENRR